MYCIFSLISCSTVWLKNISAAAECLWVKKQSKQLRVHLLQRLVHSETQRQGPARRFCRCLKSGSHSRRAAPKTSAVLLCPPSMVQLHLKASLGQICWVSLDVSHIVNYPTSSTVQPVILKCFWDALLKGNAAEAACCSVVFFCLVFIWILSSQTCWCTVCINTFHYFMLNFNCYTNSYIYIIISYYCVFFKLLFYLALLSAITLFKHLY